MAGHGARYTAVLNPEKRKVGSSILPLNKQTLTRDNACEVVARGRPRCLLGLISGLICKIKIVSDLRICGRGSIFARLGCAASAPAMSRPPSATVWNGKAESLRARGHTRQGRPGHPL